MKSLVRLDCTVHFVTEDILPDEARSWLSGVQIDSLNGPYDRQGRTISVSDNRRLQRRFQRYWGISAESIDRLADYVRHIAPDALVTVGLETLPYLAGNSGVRRIWYPADDPVLHSFTLLRNRWRAVSWIKEIATGLCYERVFSKSADVIWVVSERDQTWARRCSGNRNVALIRNGVDMDHFRPQPRNQFTKSCIFWGNLAFSPNIDAVHFFLKHVWQPLQRQHADAIFHVCGITPPPDLRTALGNTPGVIFHENLPDLRALISANPVAVFPMVSGAGVKNKVLEAAALGCAVCVSPRCLGGLNPQQRPPFLFLKRPSDWIQTLERLWKDRASVTDLGKQARTWVTHHHSWERSAHDALQSIHTSPGNTSAPAHPVGD